MTWKRWDHPAGRRLLLVAGLELALALFSRGVGTQSDVIAGLWLALGLWLVHRIHHGGHTAWSVLLTLSGLAVALGVVSFALNNLPWWQVLIPWVLNGVQVVLLLSVPVREWTRAPRPAAAARP
ncbi:hypothetical protein FHR75_004399 [Kineococcus radiotolerans]|uniref:Uncharacterized protein n=1 Tax=Kineococcus radiotolerans TaxID=131568 RepID=A0A7W4XYW3_KINRA|nr:hypothetical protein [Kineococcus radiotolerans]MBB2903556.1 hypothetical protein [Kineococcus radiotolerans]